MNVPARKVYQCRLCLESTSSAINIHDGDFIGMLENLTSIKVQKNDGLPEYSCSKCAKDVKTALSIKERIVKSHQKLLESIENEQQLLKDIVAEFGSSDTVIIVNDDGLSSKEISQIISGVSDHSEESGSKFSNEFSIKEEMDTPDYVIFDQKVEEESDSDSNENSTSSLAEKSKCHLCNRLVDTENFDRHVTGHRFGRKTKCPICKRPICVGNLKKHMMVHEAGPSTCQICGAVYKNIESLRGHIFYKHKNPPGQFVCEQCGKGFRIRYKFVLHKKKAHTSLRNFKCETCGKGFYTNADLMSHIRMTHEKLRPHVCEFCGSGFSSQYALKTHRRQHTNEKPFVCEHCNEGFRQKVSLKSHLKSKHGLEEAKEYFCETCHRGFATTYALNIHERLHMSEKCLICSGSFAAEYLETHLRIEHNIVQKEEEEEEECESDRAEH